MCFTFGSEQSIYLSLVKKISIRKTDTITWTAKLTHSRIIEVVPRFTGTSLKQNAFDKLEAKEVETTVYNTLKASAMQSDTKDTAKVNFVGTTWKLRNKKMKVANKDTADKGWRALNTLFQWSTVDLWGNSSGK